MKKKFSRLLGVGLTLVLLASLMAFATPVSAGVPLLWGSETLPLKIPIYQLNDGSDVADLAVAYDGLTIYAVTGTDNFTYKSTNAGITWTKLTKEFGFEPDLVAVAPDNADIVVVADTATAKAWISSNGGALFSDLQVSGLTKIYDLDISPASLGVNNIVAAGALNTAAAIAYFNFGATIPAWTDMLSGTWDDTDFAGTVAVRAVKFSPAFASDTVMLAVTEVGTTDAKLEIAKFSSREWNNNAGFPGYPVTITTGTGIGPLLSASIALPSTYYGGDETERIAYVGIATTNSTVKGSLNRFTDVIKYVMKGTTAIHSVAYTEGERLVAGAYGPTSTIVYRCANPLATITTVLPSKAIKSPGGTEKVVVAWAGDNVVAGTSGTNSAFAVSRNNGTSFNDISLIDTALTNLEDVAVSADGSTVYLLTNDNAYLSVWRNASSWERVLSLDNTGYIVRIAPDDADAVYLAKKADTKVYYSSDAGETKWYLRSCGVSVQDMAVESADVAYALSSGGTVTKTTNAGFIWGLPKSNLLGNGATIVSLSKDNLIVGGNAGGVAYSTDGNSSWTKINPATVALAIPSGKVQVTANGLADGNYIFAGTSGTSAYIYRWQIGTSTNWIRINDFIYGPKIPATQGVTGIGLQGGVLYVVSANATDSRAHRNLGPFIPDAFVIYGWSSMDSTAAFNTEPSALRISSGSIKLWAIETETPNKLYSYADTVTDVAPELVKPADDYTLTVNPVTGTAYEMTFSWSRPSLATVYDLEIAYDSGFNEDVTTVPVPSVSATVFQIVGPYQTGPTVDKDEAKVHFTSGIDYYWRVRAKSPIFSLYSETRTFTIEEATVQPPVEIVIPPTPPAPDITVEVPDVVVNIPPAETTQITPGWLFAIIAIGGVLVIALIVLIFRTRRVA